jgi:quinol monooxygenase YgiN
LMEVYRTTDDQLLHRETKHYQTWKNAVGDMQAEPRQGIKYVNVFPADSGWI